MLLVKYVLSKQVDGKTTLPLAEIDKYGGIYQDGFRDFIVGDWPHKEQRPEAQRAVQGVLGMMRFGTFDSPVLLEALGDLLSEMEYDTGNQQLASRAFLQASYVTADQPELSAKYRLRAEHVLRSQIGGTGQNDEMQLSDLEPLFQKELTDAVTWNKKLASDEQTWLASSPDPEATYTANYATDPKVVDLTHLIPQRGPVRGVNLLLVIPVAAGLLLGAFILLRAWVSRNRRRVPESTEA